MKKILLLFFLIIMKVNGQQITEFIKFDAQTGERYKIIRTERFNPMTGELIIKADTIKFADEEVAIRIQPPSKSPAVNINKLAFDPRTGLEVEASDLIVISLARANARQEYNKTPWMALGGPATCGTMIGAGIFGASVFGTPGFLIGSIGSGIFVPQLLSHSFNDKSVIYPTSVESPEKPLYRECYEKEMRKLRQNSIYNGAMLTCGATGVLGFIAIMGIFSSL